MIMPRLGEIRKSQEIGQCGLGYKFIWTACIDCGKERWVAFLNGKPRNNKCHACSVASLESRNKISEYQKGKHRSAETKAKLSLVTGNKRYNWKGGKGTTADGYISIRVYPNDFFFPMADKSGHIREHRLVVARALGRCLQRWEIVHHKHTKYPAGSIKDKQDNRYPENLQLVTDDRHKQISILEQQIAYLEKQNKELKARIKELGNDN